MNENKSTIGENVIKSKIEPNSPDDKSRTPKAEGNSRKPLMERETASQRRMIHKQSERLGYQQQQNTGRSAADTPAQVSTDSMGQKRDGNTANNVRRPAQATGQNKVGVNREHYRATKKKPVSNTSPQWEQPKKKPRQSTDTGAFNAIKEDDAALRQRKSRMSEYIESQQQGTPKQPESMGKQPAAAEKRVSSSVKPKNPASRNVGTVQTGQQRQPGRAASTEKSQGAPGQRQPAPKQRQSQDGRSSSLQRSVQGTTERVGNQQSGEGVNRPASRLTAQKSTPERQRPAGTELQARRPVGNQKVKPRATKTEVNRRRPSASSPQQAQIAGAAMAAAMPAAIPAETTELDQAKKLSRKDRKALKRETETTSVDAMPAEAIAEKPRMKSGLIVFLILLGLIALCVLMFLGARTFYYNMLEPVGGSSVNQVVEIPKGATISDVGEILKENNLIKNTMIFQSYAGRHSRGEKSMQAGHYEINQEMSVPEIFEKMLNGDVYLGDVNIVIPEGRNVEEIGEILESNNICSQEAFVEEAHKLSEYRSQYPDILGGIPDNPERFLEGYLFPDTYQLHSDEPASEVVTKMLDRFQEVYNSELKADIEASGRTLDNTLIMASIVELETKLPEDRVNAASVFYNRIAADMPLQSDITVDYARGEKTAVLTEEQTQIDSPYNTYINKGLPVGPICSPGTASLKAAINPAKTDYLYFVADMSTGKLYFNSTLEGHNADVEKYMGD